MKALPYCVRAANENQIRENNDCGKLARPHIPGIVKRASNSRSAMTWIARFESCDIATVVFLAALVVIAVTTYKDYSISNDEGVQHHYGELIVGYYTSDFKNRSSSASKIFISTAACSTSSPSPSLIWSRSIRTTSVICCAR